MAAKTTTSRKPKLLHPSMQRLYRAVSEATGGKVNAQSEVAKAMGTTPAAVNNWDKRGISLEAALQAQELWDINAVYVLTGRGRASLSDAESDGAAKDGQKLQAVATLNSDWDSQLLRLDAGTITKVIDLLDAVFTDHGLGAKDFDARFYPGLLAQGLRYVLSDGPDNILTSIHAEVAGIALRHGGEREQQGAMVPGSVRKREHAAKR